MYYIFYEIAGCVEKRGALRFGMFSEMLFCLFGVFLKLYQNVWNMKNNINNVKCPVSICSNFIVIVYLYQTFMITFHQYIG